MKLLLIILFFSFFSGASNFCQFSEGTQRFLVQRLSKNLKGKGYQEKSQKIFRLFERKGCSVLDSYKNQMTSFAYDIKLNNFSLSEVKNLLRLFPKLERVFIDVGEKRIPRDLFYDVPNLVGATIKGSFRRLPARLFDQNKNLLFLHIDSKKFIGFANSQLFKAIPFLQELSIYDSFSASFPMQEVQLPEDFCDVNSSLKYLLIQTEQKTIPRSCCTKDNLHLFSSFSGYADFCQF